MKYTIVIADDEVISLKSEELLIKKEFPDIEIVSMAKDGIEFKNSIELLSPDMAIVDIRMPGITGLEAIELLKKKGCKTHFIVNTAYSDFDYVKNALDMKADGYLVKPSKREEFIEAITRMRDTIDSERANSEKNERLKTLLDITKPTYESELLLSVFTQSPNEEEFDRFCKVNNINNNRMCIATMIPLDQCETISIRNLNQLLSNLLDDVCMFLSTNNDKNLIILFIIPDEIQEDKAKTWCGEIAQLISDELGKAAGSCFKYGIGKIYTTFADMKKSYQESLKELVSQNTEDLIGEMTSKSDVYVEHAKKYIENHFSEDISLEDCAKDVGISQFYLSHIIRDATGLTFVENLSNMRIDRAKMLCKDASIPIKDIPQKCGYSNIYYFYKVFKKATGKAVGEFRKEFNNVK